MLSTRSGLTAVGALIWATSAFASSLPTGVNFTCSSNINSLATADHYSGNLCTAIQSTVGGNYASLFANANANIYIEFTSDAGLAASTSGYLNEVSYSSYLGALTSHSSGDAIDTAALASLPANESSNFSSTLGKVNLTSALAVTLGLDNIYGTNDVWGVSVPTAGTSSINTFLNFCNVLDTTATNCYNGIIFLQNPGTIANNTQDYYYGTGSLTNSKYDIFSVIEHETDEILGTASCVQTPNTGLVAGCGNNVAPVDLFRYTAPGTLAAFPTTNAAYFSYNGGNTAVAWYNHAANGQDYADFNTASSGTSYNCQYVQDAQGCLGGAPLITNDGGAEVAILDAIGYTALATPEPGTIGLFGAGLALLAAAGYRRRRQQAFSEIRNGTRPGTDVPFRHRPPPGMSYSRGFPFGIALALSYGVRNVPDSGSDEKNSSLPIPRAVKPQVNLKSPPKSPLSPRVRSSDSDILTRC